MILTRNLLRVRQVTGLTLVIAVTILVISIVVSAREPEVEKGKTIFQQSCAQCHGLTGQGEGYRLFNPPPADLTSPATQNKSDEVLLRSISEGHANTAMGTWEMAFSNKERRDVLAYIRVLGEKQK